jgi:hypothetical protein
MPSSDRLSETRPFIMAALPPVPKCIQFKLYFNDHGNSNVQNLLYFSYTGTLAATDLQTLCNNLMSQWATHMGVEQVNSCSLLGVTGNDLSSVTGAKAASTLGATTGTASPPGLSNGAACVISHESARKYKGGHSRTYVPGMQEASLSDGNTWLNTFQASILSAWNAFISAFIATAVPAAVGTLAQVVAHRYGASATAPVLSAASGRKSVPLATPFTDLVTGTTVNPQVGSQRRRNQQAG